MQSIVSGWYIVLSTLAAIIGLIVATNSVPPSTRGDYAWGIVCLLITTALYHTWKKTSKLEQRLELDQIIANRRKANMLVLEKKNVFSISDDGHDSGHYTLTVTPLFKGTQLGQFPALFTTDPGVYWEDVNFTPDNATYPNEEETKRVGTSEKTVFSIPCNFAEFIGYQETYDVGYTVEGDFINPEEDWVSMVVRERTHLARLRLELPDEYKFQTKKLFRQQRGGNDDSGEENGGFLQNIDSDQEVTKEVVNNQNLDIEGDNVLEWNRPDPEIDCEYVIRWTAKRSAP